MANNEGRTSNQLAVETFMPMMVEAFHDGLREIGSLSRWLLATLVLINGAATISLLPLKLANELKLAGAIAFLLGILAALGAAAWSLYAFKRVSIAANTMLGYWLTVADDGPRVAALETTMKRHMDQAVGSRATHVLAFASVAAFFTGCALVGWGILTMGGLQ
jgi:hypothetical protein